MNISLHLPVYEMTPALMSELEQRGVLIRIAPGTHEAQPCQEEIEIVEISKTADEFGPHMLLSATINRSTFAAFGTHPDNEEVYLIGDSQTKPLYFLFGLCKRSEFEAKIANATLSSNDLICVKARLNDVNVGCFLINKDIPHGEATVHGPGKPPTFFVTEPAHLPLERLSLEGIEIYLDATA